MNFLFCFYLHIFALEFARKRLTYLMPTTSSAHLPLKQLKARNKRCSAITPFLPYSAFLSAFHIIQISNIMVYLCILFSFYDHASASGCPERPRKIQCLMGMRSARKTAPVNSLA